MGLAIGIDLGTTNSVAAVWRDGKCKVVTDAGGSSVIPSIVATDGKGHKLIGQQAKRQTLINPTDTVYGAKRFIGRAFDSGSVDEMKSKFSYEMSAGDDNDVRVSMGGESYRLEEISALIIDHIRNVVQDRLEEEVTSAVITVPAYFNESQRQSVKNAGDLAELNVLRIINEPTAAAIAYGFGKHFNKTIAVYDLGGGTFDISILQLRDNVFEVLATGGDTWLGGIDFDNRLIDKLVGQFKEETGIDANEDPIVLQRIKDACERAKIDLSSREEIKSQIPYLALKDGEPVSLSYSITRAEFAEMCADLVERTLDTCKKVIADIGGTPHDIHEVLLVGGQTRMPVITEMVTKFFGRPPSKAAHPDEAVAIGAGLMAHVLTGGQGVDQEIKLLDTLPMSIGIGTPGDGFKVLFKRNSPIPNELSMLVKNQKDDQTSMQIQLYQGESQKSSENQFLGKVAFDKVTPAPKGESQVQFIFHLDSEGLLRIETIDQVSNVKTLTHVKVGASGKQNYKKNLIEHKEPPKPKAPQVEKTHSVEVIKPAAPKKETIAAKKEMVAPPPPPPPSAAKSAVKKATQSKLLENDDFFGTTEAFKKKQMEKMKNMEARPKKKESAEKEPAPVKEGLLGKLKGLFRK